MKRLIICGDSFMSPRTSHPNKHFAEIFANRLGFHLTSYARAGFSNGGIAAQLESAMSEKPDLILLNLTNSDRIEFSTGSKEKNYDVPFGIAQVGCCSTREGELSDPFYKNNNQMIISQNLNSLLFELPVEKTFHKIMQKKYPNWDKQIEAIKQYFEFLYDERYKNITDQLMMHTILYRLEKSGIPYIVVHDWLGLTLNFTFKPDWLTQKHTAHDLVNPLRQTMGPPHDNDPGFHLTYEGSEAVANVLIEHYNRYF